MGVPTPGTALPALADGLPAVDLERADRFRREDARARYIAGRHVLRTALGELLGVPSRELRFTRGSTGCDRGKPALLWPDVPQLDFSVSHSGALVVVAVARRGPVGVDVERLRPRLDVLGVARLALSAEEVAELEAVAEPEERRAAFFRCWTRKEAYLKARADGLPGRLRAWSVPCSAVPEVVPVVPGDPALVRRWRIRSLPCRDGYAGAVAYRQGTGSATRPLKLHTLEWLENVGGE